MTTPYDDPLASSTVASVAQFEESRHRDGIEGDTYLARAFVILSDNAHLAENMEENGLSTYEWLVKLLGRRRKELFVDEEGEEEVYDLDARLKEEHKEWTYSTMWKTVGTELEALWESCKATEMTREDFKHLCDAVNLIVYPLPFDLPCEGLNISFFVQLERDLSSLPPNQILLDWASQPTPKSRRGHQPKVAAEDWKNRLGERKMPERAATRAVDPDAF
ncbi:hypothetical protein JCM10213_007190 [Rhodosporidiobolus nylandii]